MKKAPKLFMLIALSIFTIGCSSDDDSKSISNQTLQGSVFGESFTAVGGKAYTSGDDLSVNITNETADCSSTIFDYDLYVSTYVTPEVGTYNNVNVIFHSGDETPYNYLSGTVEVTAISDTEITVKILAESSSEKTVEGVFTVPICD